ncbi:TetR/AcrR family transcriptional regulator [Acetobacter persici]|uniref:TetR/AcrR family transcriptional regulator n=1 Tax=Acetobacter persici TaxID=1076596 RepID=UPI0036DBA9DA
MKTNPQLSPPDAPTDAPARRKAYRTSRKREMTRAFKEEAFERAAWTVFSTLGLDAATVRDIVSLSAVSPGSFYNYYKTKEKIFDILLIKVADRVRTVVQQSRCPTDNLDMMLTRSNQAVLRELISINGAPRFFELNQHHIRARLFTMKETRDMLEDLKQNILRLMPVESISPDRLSFIAATLLTMGLESLLYMARNPLLDIEQISGLSGSMAAGNVRGAIAFLCNPPPEN